MNEASRFALSGDVVFALFCQTDFVIVWTRRGIQPTALDHRDGWTMLSRFPSSMIKLDSN